MCEFAGTKVVAVRDLKSGENNDGDLLFKEGNGYEVLGFIPEQACFVLLNEKKVFDIVHITNFKTDE